jgi:DNA-binding NarL/FixJ family response regulator
MPKRILIADDETSVRRAIRSFIETRSQLEVCEAVDGAEALHKACVLNPDLIVLDLSMPNANGVEVALLLNRRMPRTPVVLYTMFDEVFGGSPANTLGISAIVAKSDGVAKLLGRIEALLNASEVSPSNGAEFGKGANDCLPGRNEALGAT